MKVLHLSSGNMFGGVETILRSLAVNRAAAPEMEPIFGLCFDGRLREELDDSGAWVHDLPPVRVRYPWTIVQSRRALTKFLARVRPDVVITHNPWPTAVYGAAVRQSGIPLLCWIHGALGSGHWVERWASLSRPDLVICNSHFTMRTVSAVFRDCSSEVLYAPVRLSRRGTPDMRAHVRACLGVGPDEVLIVQASRLEPGKGHMVLVEALSRMQHIEGWVALLCGSASSAEAGYLGQIRQAVERNGLAQRVRLLGERRDIADIIGAADVFCQPNLSPDAFGLAFVEALAAGVPVVTSALGGAPEVVTEDCGVLTKAGDARELGTVLESLIRNRGRRSELGAAGPLQASRLCDVSVRMRELTRLCMRVSDTRPSRAVASC